MRRVAITVLLAILLALAGCSGGGAGDGTDPAGGTDTTEPTDGGTEAADASSGPSTPSPTTTAGTATTAETATATTTATTTTTASPPPADAGLPRDDLGWVNDSGIGPIELLRAHAFTVNNASSYALRTVSTTAERDGPNESVWTREFRASADQQRSLLRDSQRYTAGDRERAESSARYREVVDGEQTAYTRYEVDGDVSYSADADPSRSFEAFYDNGTVGSDRVVLGVQFDYEFDGTVRRDGRTLYRFTADSAPDGVEGLPETATDVSATMLVDERGVVRSLEYSFDATQAGEPVRLTVTYELIDLGGTTVERPDWIDEASDDDLAPVAVPTLLDGVPGVGSVRAGS